MLRPSLSWVWVAGGCILACALGAQANGPRLGNRAPGKGPPLTDPLGDPLPAGAVARLGTTRLRHSGEVRLGFTSDGRHLASIGADNAFQLWAADDGKEVLRFTRPGLAFNLQSSGHVAVFWANMQFQMAFRHHHGVQSPAVTAAFSADGKWLAAVTAPDRIVLWEPASGREVRRFPLQFPGGHALTLSADGKLLAAGDSSGQESKVRVWQTSNGEELAQLTLPRQRMPSRLVFSADGTLLAAADAHEVRVWHVPTRKRFRLYQGHENAVFDLAFSPDGKRLASASADQTIRIWETESEEEVAQLKVDNIQFQSLAFSPDGTTLVSGGSDSLLRLWDVTTAKEQHQFAGHQSAVTSVAFSRDGKTVASSDQTGLIRLWEAATGKEKVVNRLPATIASARFVGDGSEVFLLFADGRAGRSRGSSAELVKRYGKPSSEGTAQALSPDGRFLAWVHSDGKTTIWDVLHSKAAFQVEASEFQVVGFSPDSRYALTARNGAAATAEDGARLLKMPTGKEYRRLPVFGGVTQFALTQDEKTLAVATPGGMQLWELASGRRRLDFPVNQSGLTHLAFSPDGTLLAGSSGDDTVRLWDTATGKLRRALVGHHGPVHVVAFAPDGERLASGGEDSTIRLWDVRTGEERRRLQGHRAGVTSLCFSRDGTKLISTSNDTTALVWDLTSPDSAPADAKARKLELLWNELADEDAAVAYRAFGELASLPKEAVPFLQTRLAPVRPVDPALLAKLIADLDHAGFAVRDQASKGLEKLGELAAPALHKAVAAKPSPEKAKRLKALVERLDAPISSPPKMRALRALEVLERIANPEARALLQHLAQGAPEARFTTDARDACQRLNKRLGTLP
jgi:WD40 repeat protein